MSASVKYLSDYCQPNYWIASIDLTFEILDTTVMVTSHTKYLKNPTQPANSLTLNGSCTLVAVQLNQQPLLNYKLHDDELHLSELPESFTLSIITEVDAVNNKSCMGLYASQGNLFTQCEPEGFRKITYYLDRPDVMALFTTTIIADAQQFPILLSNGNKITTTTLANGRHQVVWQDPFKKPSYLFALVAGNFSQLSDNFVTKSGKKVLIEVYSEAASIQQCYHCLNSVKQAMRWDEERFNLEYDLERYMLVASNDFNMGAMENKGLNIFNTKYVLAESNTATDSDFINVEAVVGHEYFHNWTGNRVTCRDWFQLSLKEGLTVFRDQEFTADLHSRPVKRIQDIKMLRHSQFSEDASPLAHPVRPASYLEINNFYTVTVYEKGAEVVRMYQTILGKRGFQRGMELYFSRHDGAAVTCDEFCAAMSAANNYDLSQFMLWYSQAGTPTLKIRDHYDAQQQRYTLTIEQILPGLQAQPLLIPVEFGFLSAAGLDLSANLINCSAGAELIEAQNILLVRQAHSQFTFKMAYPPTPSLLRNFSAPVIIDYPYTLEQLLNLAAHDSDAFGRWEALQTLYSQVITTIYHDSSPVTELTAIPAQLISALKKTLAATTIDPSMRSLSANLPTFAELSSKIKAVNVAKLTAAISALRQQLGDLLHDSWLAVYHQMQTPTYQLADASKRMLKNTALTYLLAATTAKQYLHLASSQYAQADNMTDKLGALVALNDQDNPLRATLLAQFKHEFQDYPLVMDKWLTLHSQSQLPTTLATVKQLLQHPDFDNHNPNKLYALVRAFSSNNLYFNCHAGYTFIGAEILRIDKFNPGVASRIAHSFSILSSLAQEYQLAAKPVLAEILATPDLSSDVYEVISKNYAQL